MVEDCIFCKIIGGVVPCTKIFENEDVLAFLDISPWSEGHSLLIPKQHFSRLEDCSGPSLAAVAEQLPNVVKAITRAVGAEGCNVLNNNGRCAGQLVDHVHFHIIPRRQGDGVIRHAPQGQYSQGRIEQIADQIRQHLK
ncbi:MAG: HIT family protein [Sedimentisphaerales bacterium]|nr:HIT family protein [Sedimentisphaerales bacterium]